MLKNKCILLISPEAWGNNFVSKHHYANYLCEHNKVYFLNPAKSYSKIPLHSCNVQIEQISKNLIVVDYVNLLPRLNKLSKRIQSLTYAKQAKKIQKHLNISTFDIVWSFDPYRYWDLNVFNNHKKIYHTVDFHPNAKFEKNCCESADIVLGVTNLIIENLPYPKNEVIKIGHGADIKGFEKTVSVSLPGKNKIKACYVGNFHNHINYDLLEDLSLKNKNVDFIMIGPTLRSNLSSKNSIHKAVFDRLAKLNNLFFIGSVKSSHLMSYLKEMDINLILFKKEFERIHCSPHKVLAYFYSEKVTLSNYIDEHKETDQDIIQMISEQHMLISKFKELADNLDTQNTTAMRSKRKAFAINNSYSSKIEEIEKLLYL